MLPCLQRALLRPALTLRLRLVSGKVCGNLPAARKLLSPVPLVQSRNLGTHPHKEPMEPLNSPQGAREFIYSLHPAERSCLLKELHRFESMAIAQEQLEMAPPTAAQLRYVLLHNAIPFIGFGFLDNAIMIAAGTQIELSIGVIFEYRPWQLLPWGTWYQTWQALGYVEALAHRLGMQIPDLSPKQADMWQTRVSSHSGKAIGVTIGCILGMFPLFFLNDDDEKDAGTQGPSSE